MEHVLLDQMWQEALLKGGENNLNGSPRMQTLNCMEGLFPKEVINLNKTVNKD